MAQMSTTQVEYSEDPVILGPVITDKLMTLNNLDGNAVDLTIGSMADLVFDVSGSEALRITQVSPDDTRTVIEGTRNSSLVMRSSDASGTVQVGGIITMSDNNIDYLKSTNDNIGVATNTFTVSGNTETVGDVLTNGSLIANKMNVLRTFNDGSDFNIGYGLSINDDQTLSMYKYDSRSGATKTVMIFGQGNVVASGNISGEGTDTNTRHKFPVFGTTVLGGDTNALTKTTKAVTIRGTPVVSITETSIAIESLEYNGNGTLAYGIVATGGEVVYTGSRAITALVPTTLTFSGLTSATSYDVYYYITDSAGEYVQSPASSHIGTTTLSPPGYTYYRFNLLNNQYSSGIEIQVGEVQFYDSVDGTGTNFLLASNGNVSSIQPYASEGVIDSSWGHSITKFNDGDMGSTNDNVYTNNGSPRGAGHVIIQFAQAFSVNSVAVQYFAEGHFTGTYLKNFSLQQSHDGVSWSNVGSTKTVLANKNRQVFNMTV